MHIVKLIQYLFISDGQKQKFLASGVPAQLNGKGRFFGNFEKELVKTPQDPIAPAAAKSRFLGALTGKTSKNLPEGNTNRLRIYLCLAIYLTLRFIECLSCYFFSHKILYIILYRMLLFKLYLNSLFLF